MVSAKNLKLSGVLVRFSTPNFVGIEFETFIQPTSSKPKTAEDSL